MPESPTPLSDLEPDERSPALGRALAERDAAVQALFESRRCAAQLAIERQHLSDSLDALRAEEREAARREVAAIVEAAVQERDRALIERDRLVTERDGAFAERDRARAARDRAQAEAHDAQIMLERVTSSTAWRMTGPLRRLLQTVLGR